MVFNKFAKYDPKKKPKYKTPTEKQRKAWNRNWYICCLRAYWHSVPYGVSGKSREKIQAVIDKELELVGAEPEGPRDAARRLDY